VALLEIATDALAVEPVVFVAMMESILFTEFVAGVKPVKDVDPLYVQAVDTDVLPGVT